MTEKRTRLAMIVLFSAMIGAPNLFALEGGYKDGLFIQSDDGLYSLKTNFHLQFQHQFLAVEGQGKTNSFQVRRGRVGFSGNAISERLTYMFLFELVGGQTNNVSEAVAFTAPNLRDGYVNYDFGNGIQIKAGQFKAPFNFEELNGDTNLQFIDRSISNDAFTFNRDMGVAFHGRLLEKKLGYGLFVMNEGTNQNIANNNNEMLFGGRAVWNFLGDHGYSTGDPEESEEPHLMAGTAVTFNRVGAPVAADSSVIAATADVAFRYRGFSALGASYLMRNQTVGTNTFGFLVQDGYYLIPEHLEVMVRLAGVIPTAAGVTNGYEAGAGLGYAFRGHKLKIVSDYAILLNSPLILGVGGAAGTNNVANIVTTGGAPGFVANQNDHRVRTQFQLYF